MIWQAKCNPILRVDVDSCDEAAAVPPWCCCHGLVTDLDDMVCQNSWHLEAASSIMSCLSKLPSLPLDFFMIVMTLSTSKTPSPRSMTCGARSLKAFPCCLSLTKRASKASIFGNSSLLVKDFLMSAALRSFSGWQSDVLIKACLHKTVIAWFWCFPSLQRASHICTPKFLPAFPLLLTKDSVPCMRDPCGPPAKRIINFHKLGTTSGFGGWLRRITGATSS